MPLTKNEEESAQEVVTTEVVSQDSGKGSTFYLKEILKILVVSLLIIVPIRLYLFQPFIVEGDSMLPNFHNREYLLVDEISYRFRDIKRGEVVIFHPPENPKTYYIKRVIGLPGEGVELKGGKIYIYNNDHPTGQLLPESEYLLNSSVRETAQVDLRANEYYVLGDNRNNSSDSRVFGAVAFDHIRGRAWIRAFPFNEFTIFNKQIDYSL